MKLCLGTVQFGMDYGVQGGHKPGQEQVFEMLNYAVNHGITMFDSAAAYGEAEDIVGFYIRNNPEKAKGMRCISKLAAGAFEEASKREWTGIALEHADKSRKALGVECLEAYLLHNATLVHDSDAVSALREVRRCGIARKIGISVYSPDEALRALEYDDIDVIQIPYNVFDRRLDRCGFFRETEKRKTEVYARSTLLQGLLTMEPDNLPPDMEFARSCLKTFRQICERYSVSPLHASVNYVGQHEQIDFIVFGVDNIKQLKEYIASLEQGITSEMAAELNSAFCEAEERLVNPVLWK